MKIRYAATAGLIALAVAGCSATPVAAPVTTTATVTKTAPTPPPVTVTSKVSVTVTKTPTSTAPATFDFKGTVDLAYTLGGMKAGSSTVPCSGDGGFDDITVGGQVNVYDSAGDVLGTGSITDCTAQGDSLSDGLTFTFEVPDVPRGKKLYQYEITHRGKLTISEADAVAGYAAASLGPST